MNRLRSVLEFVKIEHSLFALPFVLSGFLLGLSRTAALAFTFETARLLLLVLVAAASARTAAMTLNRVIDAEIDKRNPRTAGRALPSGILTIRQAIAIALSAFAALLASAALLNPLCLALFPLLVALFVSYPYAKRFTSACHLLLGLALAAAPVGGYLAVVGSFEGSLSALLLAMATLLWVAGFDILYALLDFEVDRAQGLFSLPARLGPSQALRISSTLHAAMLAPLFALGLFVLPFSFGFVLAVAAVAALLLYEHKIADPREPTRIHRAFFTVNAVLGWVLFLGVAAVVYGV